MKNKLVWNKGDVIRLTGETEVLYGVLWHKGINTRTLKPHIIGKSTLSVCPKATGKEAEESRKNYLKALNNL